MANLTPLALSVADVAQLLKIGRDSAYSLVRSGAIHSVRIGRLLRIPRTEVERFLADESAREYQTMH